MSIFAFHSNLNNFSHLRSVGTTSHCIAVSESTSTRTAAQIRPVYYVLLAVLLFLLPMASRNGQAQALTASTAPTISPAAGKYNTVQTVTITGATSDTVIYYTTDSTTPTTASAVYSAPITVATSKIVKAIAVTSGYSQSSVTQAAYTLMTATPVNSPTSGVFTTAQTISLTDATPGSTIYYTLDGSTPTTASPVYSAPFTVSTNTLVQAMATATGFANSGILSKSYNFQAAAPVLSVAGGTYATTQTVAMTTTTPNTSIYYTTDGTTPAATSLLYSGPVTVAATEKLMAITIGNSYNKSSVTQASYTLQPTAPTILPAAGKYTSVQSVSIAASTAGGTIYYTTDGTTPTTASAVYTGPITANSTQTISAAVMVPNWTLSKITKAAYTIQIPVAVPVLSLASGTYYSIQNVSISDATSGAVIYYTTDGSYPTTASSVYSGPIQVTGNMTVKALAVANGVVSASAASATYSIVAPTPVISPASGTFNYTATVVMSDTLAGATIYYTTDGSTPTTSSLVYSAPIVLQPKKSTTSQFNAIAIANGYQQSAMYSATVTVTLPTNTLAEATISTTPSKVIPTNFLGISTDWTQPAAIMGTASGGVNVAFRKLLNNLMQYATAPMMLRLTGDNSTVANLTADIAPLSELSQAVNIHYVLGVDMMNSNLSITQAQAAQWVSQLPNSVIDGIEIGNEPDNYLGQGKRPLTYNFDSYQAEDQTWAQAIHDVAGSSIKIMGPSTATSSWNSGATTAFQGGSFLPDFVSQHAYLKPASATFTPPADYLLLPGSATDLPAAYAPYAASAHSAGLKFRMGEMNSVCGGGALGISDTFQATLWSIDVMFNYLANGMDGVNWHTGQYTRYTLFEFKPQPSGSKVVYNLTKVTPLYYGLLTFSQMAGRNAKLLPVSQMSDSNVSIWATVDSTSAVHVVVINKDEQNTGSVQISLPGYRTGTVRSLTAPTYTSTTGVVFGGQTFDGSTDGSIQGSVATTTITGTDGVFTITNVPITSAVLIDFVQ